MFLWIEWAGKGCVASVNGCEKIRKISPGPPAYLPFWYSKGRVGHNAVAKSPSSLRASRFSICNMSELPNAKRGSPSKASLEVAQMLLHQQESDRGCVIFGTASLEDELESLLRAYSRKDPPTVKEVVDPLFKGYGPLSTFSGKIQVAYALGLISPHVYKTLNLIRRLRNSFAHEKAAVSFQSPKYISLFRAVLNSAPPVSSDQRLNDFLPEDFGDDDRVPEMGSTTKKQLRDRLAFALCVAKTIGRISAMAMTAEGRREAVQSLREGV